MTQGAYCAETYQSLGVSSQTSGTKTTFTLACPSTNGFCWWSSLYAVNAIKALSQGEELNMQEFYSYVWSQVKSKNEPAYSDASSDQLSRDRNGKVSSTVADRWNEGHSKYVASFSNEKSGFPVSAQITWTQSHAQWSVSWVRSASNAPKELVTQQADLASKIKNIMSSLLTTVDLKIILIIYGLLSNSAQEKGGDCSIPVSEYEASWRTLNKVTGKSSYSDLLEEWLQRILERQWMTESVVHPEFTAKIRIKPSALNAQLK